MLACGKVLAMCCSGGASLCLAMPGHCPSVSFHALAPALAGRQNHGCCGITGGPALLGPCGRYEHNERCPWARDGQEILDLGDHGEDDDCGNGNDFQVLYGPEYTDTPASRFRALAGTHAEHNDFSTNSKRLAVKPRRGRAV